MTEHDIVHCLCPVVTIMKRLIEYYRIVLSGAFPKLIFLDEALVTKF